MDTRRVVTGHDSDGKAVFVSDERMQPITLALMPGTEMQRLWNADTAHTYPDNGSDQAAQTYFPPVGGCRFGLVTFPPEAEATYPEDMEIAAAEMESKLPGMLAHMEPDDPGMHTTDTTDFEVVLSGELILELDDGAEVVLRPGDTVVQNGTRHRWRNAGNVPATFAVFMVGAHRT